METSIPVSVTVMGHPLIQSATVAWSAVGMVPQVLRFESAGGQAKALLTNDCPSSVVVNYDIYVSFAIPGWEIVKFQGACAVAAGGDQIVIDPGTWIHDLCVHLQPIDGVVADATDHLVVNIVWQSSRFSHPIKASQKLSPNQIWKLPYLSILPQDQVSVTISAFGLIQRQMLRMPARSMTIVPLAVGTSQLILIANSRQIQLIQSAST
jgi:hypothetical protein